MKKNIVKINETISLKKSYILKIQEERKTEKYWKLYLQMIGKDGISKMVLRNTLPIINCELNRLLGDVSDFNVEITMNDKIGRTSLSHRFRVEERFISNPNTFIMRLRYLASFKIPLNKADAKQTLYGIVKDEIRMQMTKDDPFDSNRITVGLGINVSKKSAIEIGFINQMEERKTSNYFHVGFRNKFDWSKKKKTE